MHNLTAEASKPGIAPANAFVLVEWCGLLLARISEAAQLWERCGMDIIRAEAQGLELCLASAARHSVKHSALVVTRRGLRKVFSSDVIGERAIISVVKHMTAKGGLNVRGSVLLGVVAGVCARLPNKRHTLEALKGDYFAFYVREFIGSRTVVPQHLAVGFQDFFLSFMSQDDFHSYIVPALEKAILRAPEVVLNDLITPLARSAADSVDFSDALLNNLLKPLLANLKSTNAIIRTAACNAFGALVSHCYNQRLLEAIAEEILLPLEQSKITAVEQRQLHAQMLSLIPNSERLFEQIPKSLTSVTGREPNESALTAETAAIVKHLVYGVSRGLEIDKAVVDAFNKGLNDRRATIRKVWALRIGDLLWSVSDQRSRTSGLVPFIEEIIANLLAIFNEVVESPLPAAQNGLVAAAYVVTSLPASSMTIRNSEKLAALVDQASIMRRALKTELKPSFLLNHKIYTKLASEEDYIWLLRALVTASSGLDRDDAKSSRGDGWAQTFLYLISSLTVPFRVRRDATRSLTKAYVSNPGTIADIVIQGIWRWRQRVVAADRESAAMAAKSGNGRLHLAIKSICPGPGIVQALGAKIDSEILKNQLVDMLVLCRPEILPSVEWIGITLTAGIDPGALAQEKSGRFLEVVKSYTMVCVTSTPGAPFLLERYLSDNILRRIRQTQ